VTATVVCCILMQILCLVSQKSFSFSGTSSPRLPIGSLPLDPAGGRPQSPYRGSAPGPRWGTSLPQTPSLLLCPPNNPVRSTPMPVYRHANYSLDGARKRGLVVSKEKKRRNSAVLVFLRTQHFCLDSTSFSLCFGYTTRGFEFEALA